MRNKAEQHQYTFSISDLFPLDVLNNSVPFLFIIFFPVFLLLQANGFNDVEGIIIERILIWILFIVIGSIGNIYSRRILMGIMFVIFFVWDCIELFCFLQFKSQIESSFWELVKSTNPNESFGFINQTLFNPINLIIVFYPLYASLIWFLKIKHRKKILVISLILPFLFVPIFKISPSYNERVLNIFDRIDDTLDKIAEIELRETLLELANTNLKVQSLTDKMTMVLVIGESHSKAHSSLYKYPRETNPLLKKRVNKGELFVFNDVVSPHSFTMYSIPKMLTLAAHDVPESFLEKPNVFDIARSAGFKTFWLCNLVSISDQNMVYTPITKRADVVVHTSIGNIQKHDAALFNAYQAALNDPAPKKLIVLQLIGNHHDYENTYPKNATVFPLDSEPSFFTTEQKKYKKIVNAYDNSVRYNDFILEEFISRFEKNKSPGFLIYCPDHGENLHELPGMIMHMEFMPTVYTVEIPMYIYLPPNNKDKELLKKATSLPFASEDLPYLLMDLGKLKLNGADMSKSPLSPQYKVKKRIVSNCGVDYEKLKIKGHGNLTNLDLR